MFVIAQVKLARPDIDTILLSITFMVARYKLNMKDALTSGNLYTFSQIGQKPLVLMNRHHWPLVLTLSFHSIHHKTQNENGTKDHDAPIEVVRCDRQLSGPE